jgi:hypothetical protein
MISRRLKLMPLVEHIGSWRAILFPVQIDNTVMTLETGWPALIRNTRNIGDFRRWKTHDASNLAMIVFTNLGSEAGLICKPQLRPVTTPKYCESVSRNPTNKAFTCNGLHRFHTVDLSPQFRKENFDVVCDAYQQAVACLRHNLTATAEKPDASA